VLGSPRLAASPARRVSATLGAEREKLANRRGGIAVRAPGARMADVGR
jgi:hypothetical protein